MKNLTFRGPNCFPPKEFGPLKVKFFIYPEGVRRTRFKKNEEASYKTVVSTDTKNFSIPAQLESVQ